LKWCNHSKAHDEMSDLVVTTIKLNGSNHLGYWLVMT
jgi:hypothetical protein